MLADWPGKEGACLGLQKSVKPLTLSHPPTFPLHRIQYTQSVDTLATTRQVALHYSPYSLPGLMGIGQWACIDWASNHIGYIGPADDVPLEGKASHVN